MNKRNHRTRSRTTLTAFALALAAFAFAAEQASAVSSAAALYLRLAAGARPAGMGEAFIAVADDATATHWNPAGLGSAPLSAAWHDLDVPEKFRPLRNLTAIKRGNGSGLDDFEFWAISATEGLVMSKGGKWHVGKVYETTPDEDIESIVRRFLKTNDEDVTKAAIERVARANNSGTLEEIERFEEQALAAVAGDEKLHEEIANSFVTLKKSYNKLLVNWDRLAEVQKRFRKDNEDNALSEQEKDRLSVGVDRSVRRWLPEIIELPFDMVFDGELTSLASLKNNIWVGTTDGLHKYDGKSWISYRAPEVEETAASDSNASDETADGSAQTVDELQNNRAGGTTAGAGEINGIPSNNITMLATNGQMLLVGTDRGLVQHFGIGWELVGAESGLPQGNVRAVSYDGADEAWAVIDNEIYHYTGGEWKNYTTYTVALDDTPEIIAKNFAIYDTDKESKLIQDRMRELNGGELSLNLGDQIRVPYVSEIKGKVTTIFAGNGILWVGTDEGLLMFDGKGWKRPGYRAYKTERPMTVTEIALDVTRGDSAVALMVADRIRTQNDLDSDNVEAGQTVWVYRNIAGSRINAIRKVEGAVHIATARGAMVYDDGRFERFSQSDLGRKETIAVNEADGSIWYAASDKVAFNRVPGRHLTLQHSKWLPELADDLSYNFISYVQNVSNIGTFGLSLSYFDYGSIQRTDATGNFLGEEAPADFAFALSYGLPLNRKTSVGATFKVLRSNLAQQGAGLEIGDGTATGLAMDFGILHRASDRFSLGAALTNAGPDLSYIDAQQSDPLPLNLGVGFAWKPVKTNLMELLLVGDGNSVLVEDKFEPVFNTGVELSYAKFIAVRMGRIHDDAGDIKAWTFGAGLRLNIPGIGVMPIDLSYIPSSDDLALSNTVRPSVSFVF